MNRDVQINRFFYTRSCEIFIECARLKSFSLAAERLSTSQSSISQTIKRLESSLELNLFERDTRPLKLTQEGAALYKKLVIDQEQNQQLINFIRTANFLKPVLEIGLIESAASFCGTELTKALKNHVGQLRLRIEASDRLLAGVIEHDLDMAVISAPEVSIPDLRWDLLYLEPWVTLFPKGFPVSSKDPLSWEELKLCGLPFIQHGKYTANSRFFAGIQGFDSRILSNRYELDSNFMIYQFVGAGLGWTITQSQGLALYRDSEGKVVVRKPPQSLKKRKVFLISRKNCNLSLVEVVCSRIKETVKKNINELLAPYASWLPEEFEFT